MTLDEQILAEAKEVRQHLVDLEGQTAHARVDYHLAIKKLHAAGGSLREIAEALELSHQRVHQIVEGPAGPPGGPPWAGRRWKHRRHGNRRYFIARFDDDARGVIVEAQKEADSLKHPYLGTEHLMLAIVKRGVEGVSYDAARQQIVERIGEGDTDRRGRPGLTRARSACWRRPGRGEAPAALRAGRHPPSQSRRPEGNRARLPLWRYTRAAASSSVATAGRLSPLP
jgi:hypothetical protein